MYNAALGIARWVEFCFSAAENRGMKRETWDVVFTSGLAVERSDEKDSVDDGNSVVITENDVLIAYNKVHSILKYRQEALYYLARFSRSHLNDYEICAMYAKQALDAGPYNENSLFVDADIYGERVLDEMCTCGARSKVPERIKTGRQACSTLLAQLEEGSSGEAEVSSNAQYLIKETKENLELYSSKID